jgi:uncharacterized protein (DUF1800 family)
MIHTAIKLLPLACLLMLSPLAQAGSPAQDEKALHVLDRLGYGPRPGDLQRVEAMGVDRYIDQQLAAGQPEPVGLTQQLNQLTTLHMTPAQLWLAYTPDPQKVRTLDPAARQEAQKTARQRARIIAYQARQARLLRAIYSPNQLQQVMTDFWFNHFNIFAQKGLDLLWVGAFEEQAIRPHALGRFRDLLEATARHPAMQFYLDNIQNTAPGSPGARGKNVGINENYARELMELHTLGVNGGYTQQDVITLAHILTGWGYRPRYQLTRLGPPPDADDFQFDARRHDYTDKIFLGHPIPGSGPQEVETALDILAKSPATAKHISYQLAQYFVADKPDPALVNALARRWMQTDGNIREVLRTLFHSRQFWAAKNFHNKFKTPYQYVVSSIRASGIPATNMRPLNNTLQQMGQPIYGYITPDGYKYTADVWLNPDAMTKRLNFATAFSNGGLPLTRPDPGPVMPGVAKAGSMAAGMMPPGGRPGMAGGRPPHGPAGPRVSAATLRQALGTTLSMKTLEAVVDAPPALQAGLILGSPDFMRD